MSGHRPKRFHSGEGLSRPRAGPIGPRGLRCRQALGHWTASAYPRSKGLRPSGGAQRSSHPRRESPPSIADRPEREFVPSLRYHSLGWRISDGAHNSMSNLTGDCAHIRTRMWPGHGRNRSSFLTMPCLITLRFLVASLGLGLSPLQVVPQGGSEPGFAFRPRIDRFVTVFLLPVWGRGHLGRTGPRILCESKR